NTYIFSLWFASGGGEAGKAIAVDDTGVYFAGATNGINMPTTGNALTSTRPGGEDCYVGKVDQMGSVLMYGTYLGGSGDDLCTALALENGKIWVAGTTESTDFPKPSPSPWPANSNQRTNGGSTDSFVTWIDPSAV